MKIPQKLEIRGHEWAIEYKWNLRHKDEKCDGLCDSEHRTIYLDRSLSRADRELTFIHEICHAIISELDIKRSTLSGHTEERIVTALSEEIHKLFKLSIISK